MFLGALFREGVCVCSLSRLSRKAVQCIRRDSQITKIVPAVACLIYSLFSFYNIHVSVHGVSMKQKKL